MPLHLAAENEISDLIFARRLRLACWATVALVFVLTAAAAAAVLNPAAAAEPLWVLCSAAAIFAVIAHDLRQAADDVVSFYRSGRRR